MHAKTTVGMRLGPHTLWKLEEFLKTILIHSRLRIQISGPFPWGQVQGLESGASGTLGMISWP